MANGKSSGSKLLGGAFIIGGLGLAAYYLLTTQGKAQTPGGTTPDGGAGKTPPPPGGGGSTPPPPPPTPGGAQPPPTPATSAALRLEVTENGSFDIGSAYYSVKDGSGKWTGFIRFPNDQGRACLSELVPGWGAIRVSKLGQGAGWLPWGTSGWGGWDTGDKTIYLYPGSRTLVTLNSVDTNPQPPVYSQEAAGPSC